MVQHGPHDPDAPKPSVPDLDLNLPMPSSEDLPGEYRFLLQQVARLKDEYDRAEYYRQQHGRRIDELQQEVHALRARNWRLEEELMALHHGNDWNAAARLVRDEVAKLIADPKCGRRHLLAGLDAFIEAIRTRGLSAADDSRP